MKRTNAHPAYTGIYRLLIVFITLAIFFSLSSCSKESTPDPTPAILPSAVNGLTVLGQDAKDSLTWSANFTDEKITNYYVYAGSSESNLIKVGTTTNTGFLHTGLTNGTKYYYAVSAVNAKGEGPKSTIVNATPNTALNKQFTMFVPQVLPGALKAAPWRYYDPKELYYSNNPFVLTDTFKYIVSARIYEGFNTTINEESKNQPAPPSKYILLNDYRLAAWNLDMPSKKHLQTLDRISKWSTGITGQSTFDQFNITDTIPVSFYIKGELGKLPISSVVKSIRLKIDGTRSFFGEAFSDKTYTIDQFAFYNQIGEWDKKTPSIYNTANGWLVIIPTVGNTTGSGAGTQNTLNGYSGMYLNVEYQDLSTNAKTIF